MAVKLIFPHVYALALGPVNVFFIEDGADLVLIDTGYKNSETTILQAAQELGRKPTNIRHIVLTHCHPDHAGSLAALLPLTQAQTWMHRLDADVVRGRTPMVRSMPSPGLLNRLLWRIFIKNVPGSVPQAEITHEIKDGDVLPGGLKAIHAPGHSAGHTVFLLPRDGGLLFAADACSNMPFLAYSIVYDDLREGKHSLAKLALLDFEAVCFGHGGVLSGAAAKKFNKKWVNG